MKAVYTEDFKKAAVQKLLTRGSRSISDIEQETGVPSPTLYAWKVKYGILGSMNKSDRRPQDWSTLEKLKAVVEMEALPPEQQGEFLRREGLHSDHIVQWKRSMERGLESGDGSSVSKAERMEDKRRIKELEREIERKDKALAETAALLVLKKKAQLIWGSNAGE
jgi:transposase